MRSVAVADGMPIDFDDRLFRVATRPGGFRHGAGHARRRELSRDHRRAAAARRTITAEDRVMAAPVAVISEPLAQRLFPAAEPIGERVTMTLADSREEAFTIVGVTADFATSQLTTERPQILLPLPDLSAGALAKVETLTRATVHLIARGAPGDEPKLKRAGDVLRELGVDRCRAWPSPASSPDRTWSRRASAI